MRLSDIIKHTKKFFEKKRRNPIQLENDSNLESNLKFLKVSDKSTPLQISDDTINVQGSLTVNGTSVSTEPDDDSAVVTALNNATENEIVTVGATTTELDAEAKLKFDGNHLFIDAGVRIILDGDTGTHTYIQQSGDDILDIYVGGDKMLSLDEANDKITLNATNHVLGLADGTEFSVANSSFAGTILGYRMIGEDAVHSTYTLTTSMAVVNSDMTVRFIAPPSGSVEVMVQIMFDGASNRAATFGLSDNATYNSLGNSYEQATGNIDETDHYTHQHFWTVTGLTAGSTYNYWFGASANGGTLNWGGTGVGRYPDFIMKVTALPTAVSDFAEYD